MPIAAALPYVIMAASAAGTVASTVQARNAANASADASQQAANSAAGTTQATADYNARVDRANEEQLSVDSASNIDAMRRDARVYLSRQTSAYTGAGVSVDSGTPLAVRVSTAGQLALREAEAHRQTVARMEGMESSAKAGLAEGQSQADAYRIEGQAKADAYHRAGTAALLSGASRMLSSAYGAYQGGAFNFSSTGATDLSAGLKYGGGATDLPAINAGALA